MMQETHTNLFCNNCKNQISVCASCLEQLKVNVHICCDTEAFKHLCFKCAKKKGVR